MSPHIRRKSRPSRKVRRWKAVRDGFVILWPKIVLWLTETVIAAYVFKYVLRS